MKKYIVIALLLVLGMAYPAYARWSVGAAGGGAAADDYADILFHDGFEDATYAGKPTNKARDLNSAAARDNSGTPTVPTGSYILDCPTANDYAYYTATNQDIFTPRKGKFGAMVYLTNTNAQGIFNFIEAAMDYANIIDFRVLSGGTLRLRYKGGDGGTITATTTNTVDTGSWVFVGASWDNTTAASTVLNIYLGSNTVDTTVTDNPGTFSGTGGLLGIGETTDSASHIHIDQAIISNLTTRDIYAIRTVADFN